MNLQDVANLTIPEGEVKMIHDKNNKLLWGRLSYDTTYRGDTHQQTYSGKNLVDFTTVAYDGANSGTGTRDGGTYTVTGNSSDRWGGIYFGQSGINLETNTTYTFSATVVSTTSSSGSMVLVNRWCTDAGTAIGGSVAQAGERSFITFTTPASFSGTPDVRLLPYEKDATAVFTDLMLEKSAALSPYEPYTGKVPAPNPDYPQDVNVVTGEQIVMVHDKNLFNTSSYTVDNNQLTITRNADGSFTVNGTSTSITTIYFNNTIVLNGDYTLAQIGDKTTEQGYVNLYKNSDYTTTIAYFNTASNNHYKNFTTSQVSLSQRLSIPSGTYNNFVFKLMLVKGTYNLTTIGDYKLSQSQSYPISLGPIELCKIGTYQDYIYKSGDDWYVHKIFGKYTFNGTEDVSRNSTRGFTIAANKLQPYFPGISSTGPLLAYCDQFVNYPDTPTWQGYGMMGRSSIGTFWVMWEGMGANNTEIQTWLANHTPIVYYVKEAPTDTKITDNTLVGQLNTVHQFLTRYGYDFDISGNLPIIINQGGLN